LKFTSGFYLQTMFSLLRVPLAPRTFLTVTHTRHHIRRFASEKPPDDSSLVPALYTKKPSPEHEHESEQEPEHEHEVKAEPHSQPQPESESPQSVPEEDPAPFQNDEIHEDDRPLRPPHGIEIDKEGHGLSFFYRKFRQIKLPGEPWEWTLVEPKDREKGNSGRSLISSGLMLVVTSVILF
jgi:hypothetical protein